MAMGSFNEKMAFMWESGRKGSSMGKVRMFGMIEVIIKVLI